MTKNCGCSIERINIEDVWQCASIQENWFITYKAIYSLDRRTLCMTSTLVKLKDGDGAGWWQKWRVKLKMISFFIPFLEMNVIYVLIRWWTNICEKKNSLCPPTSGTHNFMSYSLLCCSWKIFWTFHILTHQLNWWITMSVLLLEYLE